MEDLDEGMETGESKPEFTVQELLDSVNLAEKLEEDELKEIGEEVVQGYELDLSTVLEWNAQNDEWMRLALQVHEDKTYPWPKAANVKYPLLTMASLQFGARAYASLVPSFDVVKAKVIGEDEKNQMTTIAGTISTHMSYQVLYEMESWEEDMDKLCFTLPIIGCVFKKTYFSQQKRVNCSEFILPKDLVVNYWAKSLETANRKTHKIWLSPNEIVERQRLGLYLEYDDFTFTGGTQQSKNPAADTTNNVAPPPVDENTPRLILEQHTFHDLDDDGYMEPYVITVDFESRRVLRIAARFDMKGVTMSDDGKTIVTIKPKEYFTQFNFIPNPDGGLYGVGFGLLLGSINESANTILNQLIDAGSLSNLQSGFLSKGLRLGKAGDYKFTPGEWKWVNASLDDIKKGVFPLPVREPSNVLFQLLGMLVQAGKEVASVSEIMTGKMPGQNTPASTTMATIEQGLKVFTSIYKRIYRSLAKEFTKLFELNGIYLNPNQTKFAYDQDGIVVSGIISRDLYQQAKVKIVPAADPNMVSETQKLILFQGMSELAQYGHINTQEMTKRGLEMQGQPGIPKLMDVPPPQPPLDLQIKAQEAKDKKEEMDRRFKLDAEIAQSESLKRLSEVVKNLAQAAAQQQGADLAQLQAYVDRLFQEEENHRARVDQILQLQQQQDANAQKAAEMAQQKEMMNASNRQGAMG